MLKKLCTRIGEREKKGKFFKEIFEFGQGNFVLKNKGLFGAKNSFCLLLLLCLFFEKT